MTVYFKLKQGVWLVALASMFMGISACSSPQLNKLQDGDVILAFGDSLTYGYGVKPPQSYPAVLQELTGFKVINAGISGETTAQGLARLEQTLEQHQPKLVILLEGGNDLLRKVTEQQIYTNLRQMVQLIRQSGAEVMLVGVPEKKLFGSSLPLYEELADELEIPLEDDIVPSLMKRPSMKSDYVHFNAQGYKELALAVYEVMLESGAVE